MKKLLLALSSAAALLSTCLAYTPPDEFMVGSTIHYYWEECAVDDTLLMMSQAGHNSYRTDDTYNRSIQKDGSFKTVPRVEYAAKTAISKYGINPLHLLQGSYDHFPVGEFYPKYENYCLSMVKLGKDYTAFWQIWNEWDGGHMMAEAVKGVENTPEAYVECLKKASKAIREVDQETPIMANSFCRGDAFMFKCMDLGMLDYCDCFSVHTYNLGATPEEIYPRLLGISQKAASLNNHVPKPFYITEHSWYTHMSTVNEETQGDYCARYYLLAATVPGLKGVYWYNFNDRGFNHKRGNLFWGLTMRDYTPKQAFYALDSVAKVITKGKFVRRIDAGNPKYWLLLYKMPDNSYALAAWTENASERLQVVLNNGGKPCGELVLERCGNHPYKRNWGFRDHSIDPNISPHDRNNSFSFHTTTRPVLLKGLPEDFTIEEIKPNYMPQKARAAVIVPPAVAVVDRNNGCTLQLRNQEQYRMLPSQQNRRDGDDLSATVRISVAAEALTLHIVVTDDVFAVVDKDNAYWNGDSIQLTISPLEAGLTYETREYVDFMLAGSSPQPTLLYRSQAEKDYIPTNKAHFTFRKDEAAHTYIYELTIPFAIINTTPSRLFSGNPLGFTLLVNDNDGKGRKGYLHWGHGIGEKRSPVDTGWLIFQ